MVLLMLALHNQVLALPSTSTLLAKKKVNTLTFRNGT